MKALMMTLVVLGAAAMGAAQTDSKASGHWQGKIQIPERELSIAVDLDRNAKGVWIGSMSVVGTSAADVPLSEVAVDGAVVRFAANLPDRATFECRLAADGASMSGKAANVAGEAPFSLTRIGEAKVKVAVPSSPLTREFEGEWVGSIDAGGQVRRIGLKLSRTADESAAAVLTAVDQKMEIPVATVTITGKDLHLAAPAVSGNYRGTLGPEGEIKGEWSQGASHIPLTFKHPAR
jgi:hypothetical protein